MSKKITPLKEVKHLSRAPIVEAVIDFRTSPAYKGDSDQFREHFKQQVQGYEHTAPQHVMLPVNTGVSPISGAPQMPFFLTGPWKGDSFRSADNLQTVQFQSDGFIFSRLRPYVDWESFENEAMRLWTAYSEYVKPELIHRAAVRFINRIEMQEDSARPDKFLRASPRPLDGFAIPNAFLHQESYSVPETNFEITVVRTTQRSRQIPSLGALILDIAAYTRSPIECSAASIQDTLPQLRTLKNNVFFSSVTEESITQFE